MGQDSPHVADSGFSAYRISKDEALIVSVFGPDSVPMAKKTADKAVLAENLGDLAGADSLYKSSMKVAESHHADDALEGILNGYAELKDKEGDSQSAAKLRKRSEQLEQKVENRQDFLDLAKSGAAPDVMAGAICKVATLDGQTGNPDNADRLFKMAVKLVEDQDGTNNKALIPILQSYEQFEQSQGKMDFSLHDRIQQLTDHGQDTTASADPDTAGGAPGSKAETVTKAAAAGAAGGSSAEGAVSQQDGQVQKDATDNDVAFAPYEQVNIDSKTAGIQANTPQSNSNTMEPGGNHDGVAAVPRAVTEPNEDALLRNLNITSDVFGSSSKETADVSLKLAEFYNEKGPDRAATAEAFANQSLAILDPSSAEDAHLRAEGLDTLATALRSEGNDTKADEVAKQAKDVSGIERAKFTLSFNLEANAPSDYTLPLSHLAQEYASANDYGRADDTFQLAVRTHQEAVKGDTAGQTSSSDSSRVYLRYADFLRANGRTDEAKHYEDLYAQETKAQK
jgi:hypothetical protein